MEKYVNSVFVSDISQAVVPCHYSFEQHLGFLKNRLKTSVYRDSPDVIFDLYYGLYKKALSYEKAGEIETALDYYLWIIYIFNPIGTSYFERPAILLEKLKQYDAAILICKIHIKLASHSSASMAPDEAKKRLDRLLKKRSKT